MSEETADEPLVVAARDGDEAAFAELITRHRPELQVHCYRMLGSVHEAEDLVQETFLRAWRRRESYRGPGSYRAWLYGIATHACLDALKARRRRPGGDGPPPDAPHLAPTPAVAVPWLQPYPDDLLEGVVARETVELAFLAAVQYLPPRQRAVLLLRDVLGWPAAQVAEALGTSVASVTSALQQARPALRSRLPERRLDWTAPAEVSAGDRALVRRYVDAIERSDGAALAALLRADARAGHQPGAGGHVGDRPVWYQGRDVLVAAWAPVMPGPGDGPSLRLVPTTANGRPAVATYVRAPGSPRFSAFALAVLTVVDGLIGEVQAFTPDVFPAFGLPPARGADEF
ncbi:RNA polymerase subunit sigma-70 [Jiangella mangrovi]|uniref:RNA polymerase sigma factor n=1 Tax=Jiangella mangrovi TaxID=1524084 RepID=A0A7W9GTD2_9ACTN|nr:RNA polymerase subunit sigma-70 [Jiangella mangrovi]MBB5789391.1 RNA polymerase sigma-70 factor (ECF subfamily) [Jiangella mangrovi]